MAADFEAVLARKERGWEVRLREMYAQISKEKEDFKLQVKAFIHTIARPAGDLLADRRSMAVYG